MGQTSSAISQETLDNLTSITKFSENELSLWWKEFHRDYPSGQISKDELESLYNFIMPSSENSFKILRQRKLDKSREKNQESKPMKTQYIDQDKQEMFDMILAIFDENDDGKIEFPEFIKGIAIVSGVCYFKDRLEFAFKILSKNRNKNRANDTNKNLINQKQAEIGLREFKKLVAGIDSMWKNTEFEYKASEQDFHNRCVELFSKIQSHPALGVTKKQLLDNYKELLTDLRFLKCYEYFEDQDLEGKDVLEHQATELMTQTSAEVFTSSSLKDLEQKTRIEMTDEIHNV